jgi:ATP-binding cassette subfamily B protein
MIMIDVPRPEGRPSLGRLLRIVGLALRLAWRSGRRELVTILVLAGAQAGGLAFVVLLSRRLLDDLVSGSSVVGSAVAVAGVGALLAFCASIANEQQKLLAERCERHARSRLLDVAASVDLAAFDDPGFHDRLQRAEMGLMRVPQIVFALIGLAQSLGGVAGALLALLALEPLLVPLGLLALVPAALATSSRGQAYYRFAFGQTARDRERHYLSHLLTARETAAEVRAFELAGFLRERHDRLADERLAELRRIVVRALRWALVADLVTATVVGGTVIAIASLAGDSELGVAGAAAAAGAIVLFGQRSIYAGASAGELYECALFLEDFSAFAPPARQMRAAAPGEPGRVEAVDVEFTYPSGLAPALRGVSVHVAPGEVVALVGANGSGKSTLAKLLAGLYAPDRGEVRWNGAPATAVAFQEFVRYMLPARDNIALGRWERFGDDQGVRDAALRSGAWRDVEPLPAGYATILGPAFIGGTDLSGGQWQRVALARLFFRDAPFVILDEPTAALDAKAEHELFASIRELLSGRSVLLISHRFSSVREADRIYVLRDGAIVEEGTHESLMALGGLYAEMFLLQATAYR